MWSDALNFVSVSIFLCGSCVLHLSVVATTNLDLKDEVIGKCEDYKSKHSDVSDKNCTHLWEEFLSVLSNQDPCNVTKEAFQGFVDAAESPINKDSSMFWSGLRTTATAYVANVGGLTILEDTLWGSMLNGVTWCAQKDPPFYNRARCPCQWLPGNAVYAFWAMASTKFAKLSHGEIRAMISSTRIPAIEPESFFASIEVPNLRKGVVTKVILMLVPTPGEKANEDCSSSSVMDLKKVVDTRGFEWCCAEYPSNVSIIAASTDPCNAFNGVLQNKAKNVYWILLLLVLCLNYNM